jgi:long-chain acyl-CoA synthetase
MEQGDIGSPPNYEEPSADDIHIISYTSGTTGDCKGVKLSHKSISNMVRCVNRRLPMIAGDVLISYLPYTHGFEQVLFSLALLYKLRIGFYSGDPNKLVEDCGKL